MGRPDQFAPIAFCELDIFAKSSVGIIVRRKAGEELLSEERVGRQSVIGLADRKIIINLRNRTHVTSGPRIIRGCICEVYARRSPELRAPQFCCPVCRLFSAIPRVVHAGEDVFPAWSYEKVIDGLRFFGRRKD